MVPSEIIHTFRFKGEEDPVGEENSWSAYADVLAYLNEALARVPQRIKDIAAMDIGDIDRLFGSEVEQLALLIKKLFPRGGIEEFATYLPKQATDEQQEEEAQ